ncbi:S1 family peptidase [Sandaracinus amylolyticus]|uniref:S1 family peptidase n=1 Tax=Sandaracinus amylolyticus TaxID=927083 RepID=UPI001F2295C9|nr:trypsin-like serine protease [Sandaracinus amylolyticus]UJR86775.1 Hypothetical protein I5071_88760 [Sandaracinus amylolyticus]
MRSTALILLALSMSFVLGCSASHDRGTGADGGPSTADGGALCDPGDERASAVYHGTREPTTLPLTPGEILAIARVEIGGLCSGAVIAPRWVLTAGHCLGRRGGSITVGANPDRVDREIAIARQLEHPSLDIALLELAQDATVAVPGLVPIRIATFPLTDLVGTTAEAAGYGEREDGNAGARRFTSEPIVQVRGEFTTIDGMGERGVCFGDSGGPLMVVGEDSSVRVIGALSYGDPDCVGRDNYTRVDLAREWIEENIGETPDPIEGCDGVTEAGTCRGATAVWCEGDELHTDTCTADERCMPGPDGRATCVPRSEDPCGGLDATGRCEGGVATWCEGGRVRRADCGRCGLDCAIVAARGGAVCE